MLMEKVFNLESKSHILQLHLNYMRNPLIIAQGYYCFARHGT